MTKKTWKEWFGAGAMTAGALLPIASCSDADNIPEVKPLALEQKQELRGIFRRLKENGLIDEKEGDLLEKVLDEKGTHEDLEEHNSILRSVLQTSEAFEKSGAGEQLGITPLTVTADTRLRRLLAKKEAEQSINSSFEALPEDEKEIAGKLFRGAFELVSIRQKSVESPAAGRAFFDKDAAALASEAAAALLALPEESRETIQGFIVPRVRQVRDGIASCSGKPDDDIGMVMVCIGLHPARVRDLDSPSIDEARRLVFDRPNAAPRDEVKKSLVILLDQVVQELLRPSLAGSKER